MTCIPFLQLRFQGAVVALAGTVYCFKAVQTSFRSRYATTSDEPGSEGRSLPYAHPGTRSLSEAFAERRDAHNMPSTSQQVVNSSLRRFMSHLSNEVPVNWGPKSGTCPGAIPERRSCIQALPYHASVSREDTGTVTFDTCQSTIVPLP